MRDDSIPACLTAAGVNHLDFLMQDFDEDARLTRMIEIADQLDIPLDHVVRHMARADQTTFRAYSDNPSSLPRYMKSKVSP